MQQFSLPLLAAKQLAQALLPHVSRDLVTPALGGIVTGGERFGQYAFASDRYTIGRFDLTNLFTDEPTGEVWVPREALYAVSTLGKASLLWGTHPQSYHVSFRTGEHNKEWVTTVTVEYRPESGERAIHWMRVFGARGAQNTYPPTDRLFHTFIPGEAMRVGLAYEHLVKFRPIERTGMPLRITMPKASTTSKLSPILVESGERFKGLVAPNMLFENNGMTGYGNDLAMDNLKREGGLVEPEKEVPDAGSETAR